MNIRLLTQQGLPVRRTQTGFTLIELLVVVAIIAILASVVLASLNTARQRAQDASIQQQINNIRAQAEIFYDDNGRDYEGLCTDPAITAIDAGVDAAGGTFVCDDGGADSQVYRVSSVLVDNTSEYYCVDSTGAAGIGTTEPTTTACP